MSKARVIGAGSAGSTIYHCNVNLDTAGGNKKQGLPFSINTNYYNKPWIAMKAIGDKRNTIFTINQIGGVGHIGQRFVHPDGIHNRPPYKYVPPVYPQTNSNIPTTPPSKHLGRFWNGTPINLNYKGQRPGPLF